MSFSLNTELAKYGVAFQGGPCVFTDSYQGVNSDEVKHSICSVLALENILFAPGFSKPAGVKAIQKHEWKGLGHNSIIAAPLCLHSVVFQCRRGGKGVGDNEVQIVAEIFQKVALTLIETVENAKSQSDSKAVESICNYLKESGFQTKDADKYLNIIEFAKHYQNIAKAPELLFKISHTYLKTIIPTVNPRILELQRLVNPTAMLTSYPKQQSITYSVIEAEEVKERVDLQTYTPRIRRGRRVNHAKFLSKKSDYVNRSNTMVKKRSETPSAPPEITSTQIKQTTETNQIQEGQEPEGWCILL